MALTKIGSASMPTGSVIQTKSTSVTGAASITSNQTNTFVDLGLSLAITPQYASSKILVMINASLGVSLGQGHFRLIRDSTVLNIGDEAGDRIRSSVSYRDAGTPYALNIHEFSINFLDSPSTTSATTYKLQGTLGATYNGVVYLNRTHTDTDADYGSRCASNITLQEISV